MALEVKVDEGGQGGWAMEGGAVEQGVALVGRVVRERG